MCIDCNDVPALLDAMDERLDAVADDDDLLKTTILNYADDILRMELCVQTDVLVHFIRNHCIDEVQSISILSHPLMDLVEDGTNEGLDNDDMILGAIMYELLRHHRLHRRVLSILRKKAHTFPDVLGYAVKWGLLTGSNNHACPEYCADVCEIDEAPTVSKYHTLVHLLEDYGQPRFSSIIFFDDEWINFNMVAKLRYKLLYLGFFDPQLHQRTTGYRYTKFMKQFRMARDGEKRKMLTVVSSLRSKFLFDPAMILTITSMYPRIPNRR